MEVYVIIFSRYGESNTIKAICKDLETAISRTKSIIFYNFPLLEEKEIDIISTSENSIIVNKEISMKEILIRISPFFQADSYFISDIGKHFVGIWKE